MDYEAIARRWIERQFPTARDRDSAEFLWTAAAIARTVLEAAGVPEMEVELAARREAITGLRRDFQERVEAALKRQEELEAQCTAMREALERAVELIRAWHGIGLTRDSAIEKRAWDLYRLNAPEMKPIRDALKGNAGRDFLQRLEAADAEVRRLRPVYEAYRSVQQLKEAMKDCPECVEERCRGGAACRTHRMTLSAAECELHNAANDVRLYEEARQPGSEVLEG